MKTESLTIPDCPYCGGERELSGTGGYSCFHCGKSTTPPMTPLDQTLVDQMQSALSKSAPDVARHISTCEGVITITEHMTPFGSSWMLMENRNSGDKFWVSPETFKALELFAERIGWRPQ